MRNCAAPLLTVFLMLAFTPARASTLPVYQDIRPGEYLAVDFQFSSVPFESTGGANVLMANGGSSSSGLLGSDVLLFHDGALVATYHNDMANTFALFRTPESSYRVWGITADIAPIFAGGASRVEFHPIFDPSVASAFVNYQLIYFGAMQSTDISTLLDTSIIPDILMVQAVPLPGSLALFVSAIFSMLARKRSLSI